MAKAKLISSSATNYDSKKCNLSHYKDTYKHDPNARPATTYVPPPDLFIYAPKGSIDFNTIQKLEFKPYDKFEMAKPFKMLDNHQLSTEPFSKVSSYVADFAKNENINYPSRVKKNSNEMT